MVYIATYPDIHYRWCAYALIYTTGGRSSHTPRAVQKTAGVCRHGLRLLLKLSWKRNGPLFQELMAPRNLYAICKPVVYIATYPDIHHRWCKQALKYTTGPRSPHSRQVEQRTVGVCRHGLGLSWKISLSRNDPVFQDLWPPLRYCATSRPVVYISVYMHHWASLPAHTSGRLENSWSTSAWARASMENIVEPNRSRIP